MVPNGLLPNAATRVTRRLDAERWAVAEGRTAELIARIQPSKPSEDRRRAVADYVQRLIMGCLSCQVFTYGSVPLKTYLPDGDIDVTALSNSEHLKNTWAITVRDALEHEEKSEHAEFCVTEVQYIQAEIAIWNWIWCCLKAQLFWVVLSFIYTEITRKMSLTALQTRTNQHHSVHS